MEMLSVYFEFYVSILEVDEESNFVISMRIGTIDKEPFSSIVIILDGILDIVLMLLTCNIIRIGSTNEMVTFNSHE
jgi:hypothetical protein